MKIFRHIGIYCLCTLVFPLQAQNLYHELDNAETKLINIGIKAGIVSSMTFIDELSIGGTRMENIQNNYKIGYYASIFNRFNLRNHHLIQPEFNLTTLQGSVSVNKNADNGALLENNVLMKTHITSIDFMPLYGYHFVDQANYGMVFFIGPKISWIWKKYSETEFEGFYQQNIKERLKPITLGLVTGLALNIGKIFYDFRYDIGLHHTVQNITFDAAMTPIEHRNNEIVVKRRRNILSFSLGVMF